MAGLKSLFRERNFLKSDRLTLTMSKVSLSLTFENASNRSTADSQSNLLLLSRETKSLRIVALSDGLKTPFLTALASLE